MSTTLEEATARSKMEGSPMHKLRWSGDIWIVAEKWFDIQIVIMEDEEAAFSRPLDSKIHTLTSLTYYQGRNHYEDDEQQCFVMPPSSAAAQGLGAMIVLIFLPRFSE
jgi:hypothetical protein